jgi:hypothetical protein
MNNQEIKAIIAKHVATLVTENERLVAVVDAAIPLVDASREWDHRTVAIKLRAAVDEFLKAPPVTYHLASMLDEFLKAPPVTYHLASMPAPDSWFDKPPEQQENP